ncbi:calmodulin-beta-like isoform X1 [Lytechinus pictus]|uniref:calmodulin-beta-like isoform X1 n=1 Tax=Lytechinus pictus TaxID=7653 RepID=UPI0030B9FAA5
MERCVKTEEDNGLENVFSLFANESTGEIGVDDVNRALRSCGFLPTEEEIINMIHEVTGNKEKTSLTYSDFLSLMKEEDSEPDLKDMFKVFDKHNRGAISSASDLQEVLVDFGIKANDRDVDEMIEEVDEDLNGHITHSEFERIVTSP